MPRAESWSEAGRQRPAGDPRSEAPQSRQPEGRAAVPAAHARARPAALLLAGSARARRGAPAPREDASVRARGLASAWAPAAELGLGAVSGCWQMGVARRTGWVLGGREETGRLPPTRKFWETERTDIMVALEKRILTIFP